ncbi:MAG: TraR/DksA C4-type zinc finger protein [Caloramator sp.]|nr:TraR/DksA C4-type zinc finger protein [Caloramator sp.]
MDEKMLLDYKNKLLEEKNKVTDTINDILKNGLSENQREEIDELSLVDNHPADFGSEMFEKERRYALLDNEKEIINRIDNALKKIEDKSYGRCEFCGKDIPRERLDFMPYATTCVECENKKANYKTYRYDRPVEEEVLKPFGRSFTDISSDMEDDIMFDDEDTWQDVAQYEKRPGIIRNFDDLKGSFTSKSETKADGGVVEPTDNISNEQYKKQLP